MNHEQETNTKIPTGIASEGEKLFEELFGVSFKTAQELAKWEGELGDRFRHIFELIKNGGDTHEQSSNS